MTAVLDPVDAAELTARDEDAPAPDRDLVGTYLHEIGRTPLLDAIQEVELAKDIEAGLYAAQLLAEGRIPEGATAMELELLVGEGRRAKDTFLEANLRLVVSIARRYIRSSMPLLDLIQEGNAGLVRAVEKFDYTKGFKFSTYAMWWIRQAISRAIAQQGRTIRLPVHLVEEINRLRGVRRELTRELGREPENSELAEGMEVPVGRIEDLAKWSRDPVSLDVLVGEAEETSLSDLVDTDEPSPEDLAVATLQHEKLEELLAKLDFRSMIILRARFGLDNGVRLSLTDIGAGLGLSSTRVGQLEKEALIRLRELAPKYGLEAC